MSDAYNFAIDRRRALLLVGCFVVAAILLFFAGSISGILYSHGRSAAARIAQPLPAVKPMQSRSAGPSNTVAPQPNTASPAVASQSAATIVPVPGTPAPSSSPATAASSSMPEETPPATVTTSSATETTTAPSAPAEIAARAKPQQLAPRPVEPSYAIPLAVRVGSFAVKENAEVLMQSLKDMGYHPVMSRSSDMRGRIWFVVKLGPFRRWNEASRVATRVSIAENVRPIIGPMR